jgi:hypothetical protein
VNNAGRLDPDNYSFWKNVKSPNEFGAWRDAIVDFYRHAVHIASTCNSSLLNVRITESVPVGAHVTRRRIEYDTTDGLRIPAYLFIPETAGPVPAVIVYHGHGDGKINAAEREGTNENMLAKYLAESLGYVVLAPDARTFGEFVVPGTENHIDYYTGLAARGRLYMTKLMEDGCRDMALLRETPETDAGRIGTAGVSMGSWRALNHGVLHDEIRATVVAGLFLPWECFFSDKHCACQHIPALADKLAAEDFAATIFPRDLMIQWGLDDKYHEMDAEDLIERTEQIAAFLGCSDRFSVDRHPGMGHQFSNPEIARFFYERLGAGAWELKI